MTAGERNRSQRSKGKLRSAARGLMGSLGPTERFFPTREGLVYFLVSLTLLLAGLWQQVNLILLVFTLTAGPFLASIFGGRSMLRGLTVTRRVPPYVFSGDPLEIDYGLENGRRWNAALALFIEDSLTPADRSVSGAITLTPRAFSREWREVERRGSDGRPEVQSGASTGFTTWIWARDRPLVSSSIA